MSDEPRNWDKELAEIDKVIARTQGAPPAPARPGKGEVAPGKAALPPGPAGRRAVLSTWLRVLLGAVLAVAMTQWPYGHGCGIRLFLYLGAAGAVVVAGLWSGISSWHRRMGLAHTLALLVALWGLVLVARETLPRVGYAKTSMTWLCGP
ncbi:MAG: hypothetical protein AB7I33_01135 [Gemmatimonadales bacterium]